MKLCPAALSYLLIFSFGRTQTYRVASLCAGPVGHISYNLYFNSNMYVVVLKSINKYMCSIFKFKHILNISHF